MKKLLVSFIKASLSVLVGLSVGYVLGNGLGYLIFKVLIDYMTPETVGLFVLVIVVSFATYAIYYSE